MKRGLLAPMLSLLVAAAALPSLSAPVIIDGKVSQERVYDLTKEIHWNTSLNQALMEAKREGKMVFWVHMLGDMTGAT